MVRAMGHPWFGSKATSGLCQALIALMPPHAVYIETHLGGGAVMRRKPAALRNIGIDLDGRALSRFECGYPVELVNADCHGFLADFAFDGSELVYSDPPYLRGARKSSRRYRHDYEDADHAALLGLLAGLPCAVMVCKRSADPTFPWMSRLKLDTRLVDRRVCGCRMVIRRVLAARASALAGCYGGERWKSGSGLCRRVSRRHWRCARWRGATGFRPASCRGDAAGRGATS